MTTIPNPPSGWQRFVFNITNRPGFRCEVWGRVAPNAVGLSAWARADIDPWGPLTLETRRVRICRNDTPAYFEAVRATTGDLVFSARRARSIAEAHAVLDWWPQNSNQFGGAGQPRLDFDAYLGQLHAVFLRLKSDRARHGKRPTHSDCATELSIDLDTSKDRFRARKTSWAKETRNW